MLTGDQILSIQSRPLSGRRLSSWAANMTQKVLPLQNGEKTRRCMYTPLPFPASFCHVSDQVNLHHISWIRSKVKLMRSLVVFILLYACESWTLTAEFEKRTQVFEMRCYRRLLNISYKDRVTNEEVRRKIQAAIGEYDELLTLVKKWKLRWYGHA